MDFFTSPMGLMYLGILAWSLLYYVVLPVVILAAIFHQSIFGGLITYVVGMCYPHRGLHMALNQAEPPLHARSEAAVSAK